MSPEDRKVFDNWFELFSTPGWGQLKEDMQKLRDQVDTVVGVADERSLYMNQGRLLIIDNILSLDSYIDIVYKETLDGDAN